LNIWRPRHSQGYGKNFIFGTYLAFKRSGFHRRNHSIRMEVRKVKISDRRREGNRNT
jgi:hypothetical protein